MKRLLIPILLLSSNSFAAGIQKWVDEEGEVNYGDRPPIKTRTQVINVSRPPSDPGRPLPRLNDTKNAQGSEQSKPAPEPETASKTTEESNNICQRARKDLDTLNQNDVIRLKLDDGTERILSDEEIDARRKRLENNLNLYCK